MRALQALLKKSAGDAWRNRSKGEEERKIHGQCNMYQAVPNVEELRTITTEIPSNQSDLTKMTQSNANVIAGAVDDSLITLKGAPAACWIPSSDLLHSYGSDCRTYADLFLGPNVPSVFTELSNINLATISSRQYKYSIDLDQGPKNHLKAC